MNLKFSERLKELRIDAKISKSKLAKQIGYSYRAVDMWENNLRTPSIDAVYLLAQYFGVTSDYLLGLED